MIQDLEKKKGLHKRATCQPTIVCRKKATDRKGKKSAKTLAASSRRNHWGRGKGGKENLSSDANEGNIFVLVRGKKKKKRTRGEIRGIKRQRRLRLFWEGVADKNKKGRKFEVRGKRGESRAESF